MTDFISHKQFNTYPALPLLDNKCINYHMGPSGASNLLGGWLGGRACSLGPPLV